MAPPISARSHGIAFRDRTTLQTSTLTSSSLIAFAALRVLWCGRVDARGEPRAPSPVRASPSEDGERVPESVDQGGRTVNRESMADFSDSCLYAVTLVASRRQALHVLLSETAQRGLRDYSDRHGMSISALVEAIGILLAGELSGDLPNAELGHIVVETARTIDVERRARTRGIRSATD